MWECLDPAADWEDPRFLTIRTIIEGPSGEVEGAAVSEGEVSTGESECIREVMGRIRVRPFTDPDLTVDYGYGLSRRSGRPA